MLKYWSESLKIFNQDFYSIYTNSDHHILVFVSKSAKLFRSLFGVTFVTPKADCKFGIKKCNGIVF